jgi:hypothetical protein
MPIAVARHVPWSFFGRLGLAFAEIVLAAATLVGSVILGHELKAWRDWMSDPGTVNIWGPTPKPTAPAIELGEP